jgi:hypothetical protein
MINPDLPLDRRDATYASIKNCLKRNQQLNRVALLLVPPPLQQQQQRSHSAGTMMLKVSHRAIAKFAIVVPARINAGASAVFKLLQSRPQLLEKRLKRPPTAAAVAAVSQQK